MWKIEIENEKKSMDFLLVNTFTKMKISYKLTLHNRKNVVELTTGLYFFISHSE